VEIFITQFIYIKKGQELAFEEFESHAIPIIQKYGGKLLSRIRPNESQLIEGELKAPYEIHLVSFPSEDNFQNFLGDELRASFLHLKNLSIQEIVMTKGYKL